MQDERPDLVQIGRIGEVDRRGGNGDDRVAVHHHERLGVRVVAVHDLAHRRAVRPVRHLVVRVGDDVEVRVGPLEVQIDHVGGVGVVDGEPSEGAPRVGGQGPGGDGERSRTGRFLRPAPPVPHRVPRSSLTATSV